MQGKTLAAAVVLVGVAVVALGMAVLFAGGPPAAPPRPPATVAAAAGGAAASRYSATMFQGLLEQDARSFGLPPPRPGALAAAFPYGDELPAARSLPVGGTLQTAHLRLTVLVRREAGTVEGQTFRAGHLVMKIENLTRHHLAYRVMTAVADAARCEAKGAIAHNAVALAPREVVFRTECLQQRAGRVEVKRVEVMELPPLAYYYVSRLTPELILYDARVAAGHTPPKGTACPQTLSWREIRDGAERGLVDWRDIVDFYARHSCDEFAFFAGYRYRTDAGAPLPAREERADAHAEPGGAVALPAPAATR